MEDLKKVQEFFSRPVNEFEGGELSLGDTIKINPASFPSFEFPYGTEGKIIDISKADYASDDLVYRVKLRYIDGQGDEANTLYIENSNQYLNEQEEDAIDTISMDVPLFLRMLEYAKEDAQEDVDLHDVTQRATELSKTKPFLSMEDYNEIVTASQEIDEEVGYLSLKDDNPFDDVPSVDIQIIDDKEGASSPKAFVNFSSMFHSGDNGKMEILKNNPALQDKVMMALQSEFQKTFRRVIHGILGEPFGLNEDAFEDTWIENREKADEFIKQHKDNPFRETDVKYAKAYLDIKKPIDANKYWADFVGKIINKSSNMESLKEMVKTTLLEKKKRETAALE